MGHQFPRPQGDLIQGAACATTGAASWSVPRSVVPPARCQRLQRCPRPWWDANVAGHGCRWTWTNFIMDFHQTSTIWKNEIDTKCEQNDPCSGCCQFVSRVPNVLCLPAYQRHAAKARLLFLEMGTWANSALANGPFKYCGVYVRCIPV